MALCGRFKNGLCNRSVTKDFPNQSIGAQVGVSMTLMPLCEIPIKAEQFEQFHDHEKTDTARRKLQPVDIINIVAYLV